jgi:hypothetical protein
MNDTLGIRKLQASSFRLQAVSHKPQISNCRNREGNDLDDILGVLMIQR